MMPKNECVTEKSLTILRISKNIDKCDTLYISESVNCYTHFIHMRYKLAYIYYILYIYIYMPKRNCCTYVPET